MAQAEFWSELSIDHPSAQKLHKIGQCIEQDLMQTDKTFLKMLHLNMNSVQTMRRYAYFLAEVWAAACILYLASQFAEQA
jgi:hypothetical protein